MTSWIDILRPIMGANIRPIGGIDMLHIDSDVDPSVDEAHEIAKQIDKMVKRLKSLKVGFRNNGVGKQMGFDSIAIVGADVDVTDALDPTEVKTLLLSLVIDGAISNEQRDKCYKESSTRKGSVKFEDRTD